MRTDQEDTIGQRVRTLRRRRSWSQKALAALVPGMSQQSVDQLERGKGARPRFLPELAEALGVPERWLRTGQSEPILPAADLPPDDLDLMHEVVVALELMFDAAGWAIDLASKKLLARCVYEIMLLEQKRPAESAATVMRLAEAVLADRKFVSGKKDDAKEPTAGTSAPVAVSDGT